MDEVIYRLNEIVTIILIKNDAIAIKRNNGSKIITSIEQIEKISDCIEYFSWRDEVSKMGYKLSYNLVEHTNYLLKKSIPEEYGFIKSPEIIDKLNGFIESRLWKRLYSNDGWKESNGVILPSEVCIYDSPEKYGWKNQYAHKLIPGEEWTRNAINNYWDKPAGWMPNESMFEDTSPILFGWSRAVYKTFRNDKFTDYKPDETYGGTEVFGLKSYRYVSYDRADLLFCQVNTEVVKVPKYIDGKKIISIHDFAYIHNKKMKVIEIPEGIIFNELIYLINNVEIKIV